MSLASQRQSTEDSYDVMDQTKTLRLKTRRRISSLPNALTEMSNAFEKLGHNSCSPKLPKHLAANRRHTIHIPHNDSPVQDVTDQFRFFIKPMSQSYDEERREGGPNREADNERSTKDTHLPVLRGTRLTPEPSAGKKTKKKLQRFHSYDDGDERKGTIQRSFQAWTLLNKNGVTHASPLGLGAKSTVSENKSKLHDNRRHSLPVSTENYVTDLFSMSFSTSEKLGKGGEGRLKEEKTNIIALPQVTQAKLLNLHVNQPEKHRSDETEYQKNLSLTGMDYQCSSTTQTRSCPEGKNEKVQAMRTHLEKAEARFNKDEERAVRLFEWLKEQTDNDESS